MKSVHRLTGLSLLVATTLLKGATTSPSLYVQPGDIDYASILPGPPAGDSPEHRAELALMKQMQARRTASQAARCKSEESMTPGLFATVLGDSFNTRHYPQTMALLQQVKVDTDRIDLAAKNSWKRPRPYVEDMGIRPCVTPEPSSSYPSGSASTAEVWARVLGELFPEQRQPLLDRARQIGTDRTLAGVHFPSDVTDGFKLGDAVADKLLATDDFRAALEQAKAEVAGMIP